MKQIRNLVEATEQEYEKEKLNERIARLSGGVAIIQVGAQTETELKEKKLRVEDALNATKAAVEEGIVIGGGCTLLKLAAKVDTIKDSLSNEEQKVSRGGCPAPKAISVCERPILLQYTCVGAAVCSRTYSDVHLAELLLLRNPFNPVFVTVVCP